MPEEAPVTIANIEELLLIFYCCLSGCQTCDRYAERRAGSVVHTYASAELNRAGLTTVLTADTGTQSRSNGTTFLYGHLDELTYTVLVENLERIHFQDLLLEVCRQERSDIVAAVTEGHLRQIVRTEAEVLSLCSDTVCRQSCTRDLDHRTDLELNLDAILSEHFLGGILNDLLLLLQLVILWLK